MRLSFEGGFVSRAAIVGIALFALLPACEKKVAVGIVGNFDANSPVHGDGASQHDDGGPLGSGDGATETSDGGIEGTDAGTHDGGGAANDGGTTSDDSGAMNGGDDGG